MLTAPQGVEIDWGLYLIIAFTLVQAIVAVAALLFDAGVITAPAPKPSYEQQQQYGQYGGPGPVLRPARTSTRAAAPAGSSSAPATRRQYGGGYPGGPSTGGFSAIGQQSGPPTPPTGFPTYGQPQASQSAPTGQAPSSRSRDTSRRLRRISPASSPS